MFDSGDDKRWAFTPNQREDWERTRRRGRFSFLLRFTCVMTSAIAVALTVLGFVVDDWNGTPLPVRLAVFLVCAMIIAIPLAIVIGNIMWTGLERRYEASLGYDPSEHQLRGHRARNRRQLLMVAPLMIGMLSALLPEPLAPGSMFVCWGFAPFLLIYASIKDGVWEDGHGAVPINHRRAIIGMIQMTFCGVGSFALGCFVIYSGWNLE